MALLNLLSASVPTRDFNVSSTLNGDVGMGSLEKPGESADEPVVRVLVVRLRAMAGNAFRRELQPEHLLLGHRNAEDELPGAKRSRLPNPPSSRMYSGSNSA